MATRHFPPKSSRCLKGTDKPPFPKYRKPQSKSGLRFIFLMPNGDQGLCHRCTFRAASPLQAMLGVGRGIVCRMRSSAVRWRRCFRQLLLPKVGDNRVRSRTRVSNDANAIAGHRKRSVTCSVTDYPAVECAPALCATEVIARPSRLGEEWTPDGPSRCPDLLHPSKRSDACSMVDNAHEMHHGEYLFSAGRRVRLAVILDAFSRR
jgi:hypothetical protein